MEVTKKQYQKIIVQCRSLFINKMTDYGAAWRILRLTSLTDQIFIKAQRIRSLQTNKEQKNISKSSISEDRVYVLFFFFLSLILIFTIKITVLSVQNPEFLNTKKNNLNFLPLRRDIIDRNGVIISRNIKSYHAAIKPNLIKDKEKFLLSSTLLQLNF